VSNKRLPQNNEHFDIVVVGGGLIGAAIAWGASRAGAHVALVDEGDVAFRASRGNFGLIWLQGKGIDFPPYVNWSISAGQSWPHFSHVLQEDCGFDIGWRQPGGFHFCFTEQELQQRRDVILKTAAASGDISIRMVSRRELKAEFPKLGDTVTGASYSPADSHVSPLLLMRALHEALQKRGGVYRSGLPVDRIQPQASGFVTTSGDIRIVSDKVVIAAGLSNSRLATPLGMDLPIMAERGQIVVTERVAPFFPYVANCLRQTEEGSFLFGSSHENAGLDEGTDVETAARLTRTALSVFPALGDASVLRVWGALRVMTPDGRPIYQQSDRYPGAFGITCHSGVTLASAHALVLAPALVAGNIPDDLHCFSSGRFHVQTH